MTERASTPHCESCERLDAENGRLRGAVAIWQKLADERKEQIAAQSERLIALSESVTPIPDDLQEAFAYARIVVRSADAGRFDAPQTEKLARALLALTPRGPAFEEGICVDHGIFGCDMCMLWGRK